MRERVLVSGGSGGIGSAVCMSLAAAGYAPIVGYGHAREAAEAVAGRAGGTPLAIDLLDPASIDAAIAAIAASEEPFAGIILAASPAPEMLPFGQATAEALNSQWQVNVVGNQRLVAGLARQVMRKTKSGTLLGILSAAMGEGIGSAWRGMAGYIIAKYGLEGVLATAAADYPWLRVVSVSPDRTDTPMLAAFEPRFLELARAKGEFLRPEDVARNIVDRFVGHV